MQVFDDKATFAEWFGNVLGKAAAGEAAPGDEWLETEKRVVVIHRLHQILEPFMLRRQVQDVEGKLPPKVRAGPCLVLPCSLFWRAHHWLARDFAWNMFGYGGPLCGWRAACSLCSPAGARSVMSVETLDLDRPLLCMLRVSGWPG